ncbi:MAG: twin-arginine translocase subunit TatC [Alphaproteobacteria bacterium]|nr:twin-arginine translocase subunit TatC [Alphaproteobacteria bacterium]
MADGVADPDDAEMEASRAPLLDHLVELRQRLLVAVIALLIAFVGCFSFAQQIFVFLVEPFKTAIAAVHGPEAAKKGVELVNTHAFGFFFVQLHVALFAAIIVAFPVIAYQAYAFIAPGLYKRERAAAAPFLIAAPIMFLAGAAFVFYVAMPFALEFALKQEVNQGGVIIRYLPKVDEYFGLVTTLTLAFGFIFQVPVVLSLLARIGIVTAGMLRRLRRYAIVGIAAFSALVTPPDPISMMVMAVPVYGLYEISIWLVLLIEKARLKSEAKAAQEAA